MNVQKKIACMLAGITVLFLCCVIGIRYYLIYNNRSLFENQADDKVAYFDQVLQFQQTTLEMFAYDAAVNRAVVNFVRDHDAKSLQKTLADAMPSYGVDSVWICDIGCRLLHHECALSDGEIQHAAQPADLARMFRRGSLYRQFFTEVPLGIMEIRTAPAGIAAAGDPDAPPEAVILAGRLWSQEYMTTLEGKSGAKLKLTTIQNVENLEPSYNQATGRLHFARVLFDDDRRPLRVLRVSYGTPLIKTFNKSSNMQVTLLLIFGLAIFAMLAVSFAAWVISPLKKISMSLRTADPRFVADIPGSKNEFGTIARLIENFFRQKDVLVAEINERRQAEEALRHSQERFRALVETTSDLIWEVDADLTITYVSPRSIQMFGFAPDELIGKNILGILSQVESRSVAAGTAAETFRRREPFNSLVYPVRHKDGRLLFIEASAVPVCGEDGSFCGYRGIDRDITERRQIEAQLQQALKMEAVGTLAGGIAHDFNNILTVIIGNTQLAQLGVPHDSALYSNLDQVLQASQRASEMVRQILDFSRQAPVEKKPVHIIELVQDVLKMLRASLPSYVTIQKNIACDRDVITANPSQIQQIIMNLCVNAAHAMEPDGGILAVELASTTLGAGRTGQSTSAPPGDYVRLSISDTGCGIPAELLSKIFDPFFTTKEVNKGTGLGLSVVLGLVRQHGGEISVESTPGKGSVFHVLLPLADSVPRAAGPAAGPSKGGAGRILAVDDEEQVAHMLEYMLRYLGYSATVMTDSRKALELFSADPDAFDLVISDLTMPYLTGEALVRKLREIRASIPVILTTGFSGRINEESCKSLNIQGLFMKPFVLTELAELLSRLLSGR